MDRPPLPPGAPGREIAERLEEALARVDDRIECAWLFGSTARGDAGPLSDVDVAVLFAESVEPEVRLNLAAALVEDLERQVARIDLAILNDASPLLQDRAIRDGVLLLDRDPRRRVAFEVRSLREYLDFQPILAAYDRVLLARAREGRLGT